MKDASNAKRISMFVFENFMVDTHPKKIKCILIYLDLVLMCHLDSIRICIRQSSSVLNG